MNDHASDRLWKRQEVESPCIKICIVHPEARICTGCHRTLDEIAAWSRLSAEERRDIIADLPGRAGLLRQRRGGRAGRRDRGGTE